MLKIYIQDKIKEASLAEEIRKDEKWIQLDFGTSTS